MSSSASLHAAYQRDLAALKAEQQRRVQAARLKKTLASDLPAIHAWYHQAVQARKNQLNADLLALQTNKPKPPAPALAPVPAPAPVAKPPAAPSSAPAPVPAPAPAPKPAPKPKTYALLAGLNYRGTRNELYGCIQDVCNVRDWLRDCCAVPEAHISLLTDDTPVKPTRANLLAAFGQLLDRAVSGDRLFFHFSGHGTYVADRSGDELDGRDEQIVCLDNACLTDDELGALVRAKLKPGVQMFALFDSCFSGTMLDLNYQWLPDQPGRKSAAADTQGQIVVLSGCRDNQTSADAWVQYLGQSMSAGAMTFAFLSVCRAQGDRLSALTPQTLLTQMRDLLKRNGYLQVPQCTSGRPLSVAAPLSFFA